MLEGAGHLGPKLWRVYCIRVTWHVNVRAYNWFLALRGRGITSLRSA